MEIAEFLLARIAEDEAVALAARATEWFTTHNIQGRMVGQYGTLAAEHLVRFDPARVLAECQAKRRIVEDGGGGSMLDVAGEVDAEHEWTMQWLALPFADHPDYQPEWKP